MVKKKISIPKKVLNKKINKGQILFNRIAKDYRGVLKSNGKNTSWQEAQKFASKNLYPEFKGKAPSSVSKKNILDKIQDVLKKELLKLQDNSCFNVSTLSEGTDLDTVNWYDLFERLQSLPLTLQIRINGGTFGNTAIDKIQNISFNTEISPIIENIRNYVKNKSGPFWDLYISKNPNSIKGTCEYFIDFILSVDDTLVSQPLSNVDIKFLRSEKEDLDRDLRLKKNEERKKIESKQKKLDRAKARLRPVNVIVAPIKKKAGRPKKVIKKTKIVSKKPTLKPINKKTIKKTTPVGLKPASKPLQLTKQDSKYNALNKTLELLRKDYDDGIFTVKEYKEERTKIMAKFEKGGEI
jgi:hypothetical protein